MPRLPDGDPAPADGALPAAAVAGLGTRPLGVYVHVPYCASRCGYCDFNTYVAPPAERARWREAAIAEVALAARTLGPGAPAVDTVFFGGGTPTLLPPADLVAVLGAVEERLGLAPGAEVSVEANPETVTPASLAALRAGGFTRISLGMQSAAGHVLGVLGRAHTPGRAVAAAREARTAGFEHVSLDLIFGTPGESDRDLAGSLEAALAAGPDHVSLYGLMLEPGTRLTARVRRGELAAPDDDAMAARYEAADATLAGHGFAWYELANWASGDAARCRHNLGYWRGGDWWGVGPGAHSHVGGVRWWNLLRPVAWRDALAAGRSPAAGRETPGAAARRTEAVMLGLRLAEGLALRDGERASATELAGRGLLDRDALAAGRAVLTLRGRLLADTAVRALVLPCSPSPRARADRFRHQRRIR
jgi:oxygen-independent coproporphyrinogen-3 oxidase